MTNTIDTYRTLTTYLVVPDADGEIRFLQSAFDATESSCQRNPDGTVMHAEFRVGDSLIMLGQAGEAWKPLPAAVFAWLPDVDAAYDRALKAGASSQSAPEDKPYGHRTAGVVDPNGITWYRHSQLSRCSAYTRSGHPHGSGRKEKRRSVPHAA